MAEWRVGDADELSNDRKVVRLGDQEAVVFDVDGALHAYENRCPHAGGPVCQGRIMPRVVARFDDEGAQIGARFDVDDLHVVCPWHGWEFHLETGVCVTDARRRLRRFTVERRDDGIYVSDR